MTGYRLRRWTDADLPLLIAANAPEMTAHLGGPETDARVRRRHEQYVRGWDAGMPRMFSIRDDAGVGVGGIGWWPSEWDGHACYEAGWTVLPAFQRRGAASAAVRLLVEDVRAHLDASPGAEPLLMACPNVDNDASNALCRTVGFERRGRIEEEYRGVDMTLNVWTYALR